MNKVKINLKLGIKKKFDLKLIDRTSKEHLNLASEVLENFSDDFQRIAKEKDLTVEELSVSFEQEATVKIWFKWNNLIFLSHGLFKKGALPNNVISGIITLKSITSEKGSPRMTIITSDPFKVINFELTHFAKWATFEVTHFQCVPILSDLLGIDYT